MITLKANMMDGNVIQEFRLKDIDEAKNYLIEEINLID